MPFAGAEPELLSGCSGSGGTSVGTAVGAAVGSGVGASVGSGVGAGVGAAVGAWVGMAVGVAVGVGLGVAVASGSSRSKCACTIMPLASASWGTTKVRVSLPPQLPTGSADQ